MRIGWYGFSALTCGIDSFIWLIESFTCAVKRSELYGSLIARHGAPRDTIVNRSRPGTNEVIVDTQELARLLAYPSANAIRQAHRRGTLPIALFHLGARRRLFAKLIDVENLLSTELRQAHPPAPKGAIT